MVSSAIAKLLLVSQLALKLVTASSLPLPVPRSPSSSGKVCTLSPLGCGKDDTPQILKAFEDCNNGGTVVFPEGKTFYIASRMNPVVRDVTVEWRGLWQVRRSTRRHRHRSISTDIVASSQTTWTTGATTRTTLPSRTMPPGSSSAARGSASTATVQEASTGTATHGTMLSTGPRSPGAPCPSSSGTSVTFLSSTVSGSHSAW